MMSCLCTIKGHHKWECVEKLRRPYLSGSANDSVFLYLPLWRCSDQSVRTAKVRKGQFEGSLKSAGTWLGAWLVKEDSFNCAGTAVGARMLIAYSSLDTRQRKSRQTILPKSSVDLAVVINYLVKRSVLLEDLALLRYISMVNLEKFLIVSWETVRFEAKALRVGILGSEVIS